MATSNTFPVSLLDTSPNFDEPMDGALDNLRIWHSGRTQAQICADAGLTGGPAFAGGRASLGRGPGLGVVLDEAWAGQAMRADAILRAARAGRAAAAKGGCGCVRASWGEGEEARARAGD